MKKIVFLQMILMFGLYGNDLDRGMKEIKKRDYDQAAYHFDKACHEGHLKACVKLGVCYQKGKGVKKDTTRAFNHFSEACNEKEYEGCVRLANMYRYGREVKQNKKLALDLYKKSCEGHYASACLSLGQIYEEGKIVEKSTRTALKYYKKACDDGERISCGILGDTYANVGGRDSLKKDIDKAIMYYEKSCAIEKTSVCKDIQYLRKLIKHD